MTFSKLPENIIDEALRLFDEGASIASIKERFSEYREDLDEMFSLISEIRLEGTRMPLPSHDALKKALSSISVTPAEAPRYSMRGDEKVTPHITGVTHVFATTMSTYWKIFGSLGAVTAIALIFFTTNKSPLTPESKSIDTALGQPEFSAELSSEVGLAESAGFAMKRSTLSPATGSIDDAYDAVIAEATTEEAQLSDDAILVLASVDSESLATFETEFNSYEY